MLIADIDDTDRAHDSVVAQRHPKITVALLKNSRDVNQVWLLLSCNLHAKLDLLDRQDQRLNSLLVARFEFNHFNFLFHNTLHDTITITERICLSLSLLQPIASNTYNEVIDSKSVLVDTVSKLIELRQLRYFVRIAELEHFGQAAQELHVVQPALSRQIKQLEEELGVELFDRLPRGVRLTEAGKVLLTKASAMLDEVDRMVVATQLAAAGKTGFLKIGFADGATYSGHVPEILGKFRKSHPKVEMQLVPASSITQAELLANDSIDVGFVYWVPNNTDSIKSHSINDERIVLAAAKTNRSINNRKSLALRDLIEVPFVWFKRTDSPLYFDLILSKCAKAGLTMNVVQEAFTESTMLSLVSADIGVTFITESARKRKPENVALIELRDLDATITMQAMWRSDNRNPALKPFISVIKSLAPSS